jgi:uncharacterized delta-60 repeat protein
MKRLTHVGWLLAVMAMVYPKTACAQAGFVDTSFLNGMSGPNSWVWALALQPDGKVLVGGQFTSFNGLPGGEIARLSTDGSVDTNFSAIITAGDQTVNSLALQPDGKVLVGGIFTGINGVTRVNMARLNADGSVDSNFVAQVTGSSFVAVSHLALQTNSQVVLGGWFDTVNGVPSSNIARLNADGTLDTHFLGAIDTPPNALALQADQRILIGGAINTVDGQPSPHIARLNTDGTLDTNFAVNADGNVDSFSVQPDGKLVIGGGFTHINGQSRNRVARLKVDGTLDAAFQNGMTGADAYVNCVAVDPNGKVIVGGQFSTMNGVNCTNLARLNSDGSLDTNFVADVDSFPEQMVAQPDARVIIEGSYITTVNERSRNRIARLQSSIAPMILNAGDAGGNFSFDINAVAGVRYGVETSTNLMNWSLLLSTNAAQDGLHFIDGTAGLYSRRFFRVYR